tara:strand:- start:2784 stop:3929 length:1146 start_codon:yes stop_codon:yes gene_type:complete
MAIGPLINLGAGLAKTGYGLYQENLAKRKMAQADQTAMGPIRSQAARQRIARQESDSQSAIDSALRSQATQAQQIGATGGSRALQAATPGLLRATELTTGSALDRFGSLGARTSQLEDKINLANANVGVNSNLARLQRAADAARSVTLSGVSDVIGGTAGLIGGIGKKSKGTDDAVESITEETITPEKQSFMDQASIPMTTNAFGEIDIPGSSMAGVNRASDIAVRRKGAGLNLTPEYEVNAGNYVPSPVGLQDIDTSFDTEAEYNFLNQSRAKATNKSLDDLANRVNTFEDRQEEEIMGLLNQPMSEGGELDRAEKTPGEFDHEENPIDIVQEGDKIGEMTGGEYIFNPEQAEELLELSKEGDSELHEFVRNLLSKEQFK